MQNFQNSFLFEFQHQPKKINYYEHKICQLASTKEFDSIIEEFEEGTLSYYKFHNFFARKLPIDWIKFRFDVEIQTKQMTSVMILYIIGEHCWSPDKGIIGFYHSTPFTPLYMRCMEIMNKFPRQSIVGDRILFRLLESLFKSPYCHQILKNFAIRFYNIEKYEQKLLNSPNRESQFSNLKRKVEFLENEILSLKKTFTGNKKPKI